MPEQTRGSSRGEARIEELGALFQREGLTPGIIATFQGLIYEHYRTNGRVFPWRETQNPYRILVSEIMLQQTQTARVLQKYQDFITAFPDFSALATAPLHNILHAWQGLGYNRRAVSLRKTAQMVVASFDGRLPSSPEVLMTFPGIGHSTASAIAAFAFNQPTVFVETNIRTTFVYFFFQNGKGVTDRDILPLVDATLDRANPREWYYALFDYGAMLKKKGDVRVRDAHPRKQAPFRGSNREMRGQILRLLLARSPISEAEMIQHLNHNPVRIKDNVEQLRREGFITKTGDTITI